MTQAQANSSTSLSYARHPSGSGARSRPPSSRGSMVRDPLRVGMAGRLVVAAQVSGWPHRRCRRDRRGRTAQASSHQMAQRVQAGAEGRGIFAMHHRSRATRRGGEVDHHPRDGEARHEIHRSGFGGLAAHPVQSQIASGDRRDRDERQDSLTGPHAVAHWPRPRVRAAVPY